MAGWLANWTDWLSQRMIHPRNQPLTIC